jgi:hypothetical protein
MELFSIWEMAGGEGIQQCLLYIIPSLSVVDVDFASVIRLAVYDTYLSTLRMKYCPSAYCGRAGECGWQKYEAEPWIESFGLGDGLIYLILIGRSAKKNLPGWELAGGKLMPCKLGM